MTDWGPETYGERAAADYDRTSALRGADPEATADRLAVLAGGGPVLELGIGTGRVALPLIQRGVEVHGIDASEAMVALLRAKPGGAGIPVAMGDFADVPVEGTYPLVFIAFNTFFALLTAEDQRRCFSNVRQHLRPGGRFVMEGFVPDLRRFDRGQRVGVTRIDLDEVELEISIHDAAAQRVDSSHVLLREDGIRLIPVRVRYAWPVELDEMARAAGLELEQRWGGWSEEPFDESSDRHVSVYRLPA